MEAPEILYLDNIRGTCATCSTLKHVIKTPTYVRADLVEKNLAIPADPTRTQLMAAMTALQFGASWARNVDAPNHAEVAERLQAGADGILVLLDGRAIKTNEVEG